MNIFIDTNVFLDVVLKRENYQAGLSVLNACGENLFQGVVSDITLLNIDYVAKKQVSDLRKFLTVINDRFVVIGADNKAFSLALETNHSDLEDVVQYGAAERSGCELIVTNDKAFFQKDIRLISSSGFVKEFL